MSSLSDSCPVPSREELVNNEYKSDVKFIVGQDKTVIFGHKLLIELYSPIFYKMFNCDFKEKKNGSVEIEDIEPEIFLDVLKYMYTGKVSISKESLVPLYHASDKYMIDRLNQICIDSIDLQNVLMVLQMNSEMYNFPLIHEKCLEFIIENPIEVIELDDILTLNKNNLELILRQRFFKCTYDDLLAALKRWKRENEENSIIELENEILSFTKKENQCRKLLVCGNLTDSAAYTNTTLYNTLDALKCVKLIGVGIMWKERVFTSLKISIDDNLILNKDLEALKHDDNILEIFFKKISIEKHQIVSIEVGKKRHCYSFGFVKPTMTNSYFEFKSESDYSAIQYLIVENLIE